MSESKAVFMDAGNGDIYAGLTKEACLAAMKSDCDDFEFDQVTEVDGSTKIRETDENEMETGKLVTLNEEYTPSEEGYCIATTNL